MPRSIIVSNRLPYTLRQRGSEIECTASSGGLVTALGAYLERQRAQDPTFESLWVGWPGSTLPKDLEDRASTILEERHARPIFLSQQDSDDFYYGFCNRTLWPLVHYFPSYVDFDADLWATYVRVNRAFAEQVARLAQPDDTIWVHDYQLLLLPEMLREVLPAASIGFFLHTPFPSYEIFRLLPRSWQEQLLRGMLGADLVGFHVHEYTQHFLQCTLRILGHDHHLGRLVVGEQVRRADTFPLGIEFEKFTRTAEDERVVARSAEIASGLRDVKLIVSVDRLDYTKGIAERLRGYERFLDRHPEWLTKVAFVLLVVPSRIEVPQYQQLKIELDERVGALNGRFGTLEWTPVVYQYHSVDFEELVALYRAADVALITPLRDGMNLVAKEYLACKPDNRGVLILSELAGAAREMNEAVLINPNHHDEIADAIEQALDMPVAEQERRNRALRRRLEQHDASGWARQFLGALDKVKAQQRWLATKQLSPSLQERAAREFAQAERPLLLLDYDGTLVPIAARPELAAPDAALLDLLSRLTQRAHAAVFLISGRERSSLERWFGDQAVGIVAEHGVWQRDPRPLPAGGPRDGAAPADARDSAPAEGWHLTRPLAADWKEQIASILRQYATQVAGSFLEEKDFSLAWHYREADPELGAQRAKELMDELTQYTANLDIHVLEGKKVVEVRNAGVTKGTAAAELVRRLEPDFILAIGDDQTDEDVFKALPAAATTVHVGSPLSNARFCISTQREVRTLLERLASARAG